VKSPLILAPFHTFSLLASANSPNFATLLIAPVSIGLALDTALSTLCNDLKHAVDGLQLNYSHDVLVLLNNCLGGLELQHLLSSEL
jgi:hypothetical protein